MASARRYAPWLAAVLLIALLFIAYERYASPPANFEGKTIVVIARGSTLPDVAHELVSAHVLAHPNSLRYLMRIAGLSGKIHAGPYLFEGPENIFVIAYRLSTGDWGLPPARITFPEGLTVREMASKIEDALPFVSAKAFLVAASSSEGVLFPDTYVFPPDATAPLIVSTMRSTFDAKLAPLAGDIRASGRSLRDTVILASLIEKEARTTENRKLVAGILLNRLALGMPLQVDAVFGYIFNRETYSPSLADLKVNSPYNTYTHAGLPPGAIDNPGMDALLAAIHPADTKYLYYLTDKNGVMHYATTYQEHLLNQQKFLK
ncbi:MAG TPA: endolytic transglycosylase MltG [Candidatus Paceibacterota bacterium]|nr:endolytic transglycosylase MltG [Candidatus Paceibacterota bacterium]